MILNSEVTCFMYLITLLGPIINTVLLYTAEEKRIAFPELWEGNTLFSRSVRFGESLFKWK